MSIQTVGVNIAVDLIFGAVIRAKTGGDKAKEAARATELEAIVTAVQKVVNGDVADGLPALQAALVTTALDPAETLAVQNFISFAGTQGAAITQVAGGTVTGQLVETVVNNIATEIVKVCNTYVVAAPVTPAA